MFVDSAWILFVSNNYEITAEPPSSLNIKKFLLEKKLKRVLVVILSYMVLYIPLKLKVCSVFFMNSATCF